jgi:hypothetical protein
MQERPKADAPPSPPADTDALPSPPADEEQRAHFFWCVLFGLAAFTELGLVPGLRGAGMGLDSAIDRLEYVSNVLSQVTSTLGWLLLTHATLRTVPRQPLGYGALRVMCASVVVVVGMMAHLQSLPDEFIVAQLWASSLLWVALAFEWMLRGWRGAGYIWLWTAAVAAKWLLGSSAVFTFGPTSLALVHALTLALVSTTAGWVFVAASRATGRAVWFGPLFVGAAIFLTKCVDAAHYQNEPLGIVVIGRSLDSMASDALLSGFPLSLGLVVFVAFLSLRSGMGLPLATLVLALSLPASPLGALALGLGAVRAGRFGQMRADALGATGVKSR